MPVLLPRTAAQEKEILLERYHACLEHRNYSSADEKIRTVTVPGQTLERGNGRSKSPRQS